MSLKVSNWFGFILLCFPAFKNFAMQKILILNEFMNIWTLISFFFIMTLISLSRIRISVGIVFILFFELIYLLSTFINNLQELLGAMSESIRSLIIPLYLMLLYSKNNELFWKALEKLSIIISLYLIIDSINVFYQIFFDINYSGASYTLLGLDNYAAFSIVPMLGVVLFNSWKKNKKISNKAWLLWLVCFIAKVATICTTAIISLSLMGFLLVVTSYFPNIKRFLFTRTFILLTFCFVFGVALYQIQTLITPILELLGKDETMSFRTVIWPKVVAAIFEAPILGYGKVDDITFKTIVGLSVLYDLSASHPHNYILAILFHTGLLGSICYLFFILTFIHHLNVSLQFDNAIITLVASFYAFIILGINDDYIMQPPFYYMSAIILIAPKKQNKKF